MVFEKSAGAVVFRRAKNKIYYLLLRYRLGHWDFSKGNIEKGEKLKDTAKREIREETGIKDVKFIKGFKERIKYFYKFNDKNISKIVVFFLAETKTEKIKISFEHIGSEWLPYEQALKQLTFLKAKDILKKSNGFLPKAKNCAIKTAMREN